MAMERDYYCPGCEEEQTFYRAASTTLHLGTKIKWHCPDCPYGVVEIGDDVDTSTVDA